MAQLIMISAKQGGGKSSLAAALRTHFLAINKTVFVTQFAKPLYELHDAVIEKATKLGLPITRNPDGPLLQIIGTDWGRNTIDQSMWCNFTLKECLGTNVDYIIIDDLRMRNEFSFADGKFDNILKVRLECPEEIRRERRGLKWRPNTTHQSEVDLDAYVHKFDLVFHTDKMDTQCCAKVILDKLGLT
jgi:hypothetical protein